MTICWLAVAIGECIWAFYHTQVILTSFPIEFTFNRNRFNTFLDHNDKHGSTSSEDDRHENSVTMKM